MTSIDSESPERRASEGRASLAVDNDGLLLCFSHLRWDFVYQRPQHLLARAARSHKVLYFEEPVQSTSAPTLDVSHRREGVAVVTPILPAPTDESSWSNWQRQLLDRLLDEHSAASRPRTFWYYTPLALTFSGHLQPDLCIYDNMDELSAFRFANPELVERERELFARADLVFTGGHSLFEAKRDRHHAIYAFPSSIDATHFLAARSGALPEPLDQACIPHPRLGFFGVIDERMDLALLADLAGLRPDWQFVMIGPTAKIAKESLPCRANLHWLGPKAYSELPDYLSGWDAGIMPFALNESTRFISPTKTPEFLAAGLPVVSTPIADVVRPYGDMGLVEIAATAGEFAEKAAVLMDRSRSEWLGKVDALLASTSWDRTWAEMDELMRGARKQRASSTKMGSPEACGLAKVTHEMADRV